MADNGYSRFTPTESRLLSLLSDGLPHSKKELHACLYDSLGILNNIQAHISHLRSKIRPKGEDIVCEYAKRQIWYRHVRLLRNPYRE